MKRLAIGSNESCYAGGKCQDSCRSAESFMRCDREATSAS